MDEVAYLLGDGLGRPISPMMGSILRCTHDKMFDPRDTMLSGYRRGPNGGEFESAGLFTHGDDFHHMSLNGSGSEGHLSALVPLPGFKPSRSLATAPNSAATHPPATFLRFFRVTGWKAANSRTRTSLHE